MRRVRPSAGCAVKRCTKCKVEKAFPEFRKDASRRLGYSFLCKACEPRRTPMQAAKNRAYVMAWRQRNPCRDQFHHRRNSALHAGIPFTITLEEIVWPERCPVLDIPLSYAKGRGSARDDSPSIDRISSRLGYVPGNVAVISHRANTIKNSGTAAEHRAIANWIEGVAGN